MPSRFCRASFSASMAAPRAPAVSQFGITWIGIVACSSRWLGIAARTNTFDPDAFIVGGGALETSKKFQQWFIGQAIG